MEAVQAPLSHDRAHTLLAGFAQRKVLVVGDLFADEYTTGEVARISREAPVLILHHTSSTVFPGGAANTAANLGSLGLKVDIAGVVGMDLMAQPLKEALQERGVNTDLVLPCDDRPTTTKTRISAGSKQSVTQQIVRVDRERKGPLPETVHKALLNKLAAAMPNYDAVLLSDYGYGVLGESEIAEILRLAKQHGVLVTVDSQGDLSRFPGAKVLTPNQPEAEAEAGFLIRDEASLQAAGLTLLAKSGAEAVLITRGGAGMALFERDKAVVTIPAYNRSEVFDVTGAGDTVVGTLTAALAAGASLPEAMVLANVAASIVVRRFGTSVTTTDEIKDTLPVVPLMVGA